MTTTGVVTMQFANEEATYYSAIVTRVTWVMGSDVKKTVQQIQCLGLALFKNCAHTLRSVYRVKVKCVIALLDFTFKEAIA